MLLSKKNKIDIDSKEKLLEAERKLLEQEKKEPSCHGDRDFLN